MTKEQINSKYIKPNINPFQRIDIYKYLELSEIIKKIIFLSKNERNLLKSNINIIYENRIKERFINQTNVSPSKFGYYDSNS